MSSESDVAQVIHPSENTKDHVQIGQENSSHLPANCSKDLHSEIQSLRDQNLALMEGNLEDRNRLEKRFQEQMARIRGQHEKQIIFLRQQRELNDKSTQSRNKILQDMQNYLKQSLDSAALTLSQQQNSHQIVSLKAQLLEKEQTIKALNTKLQAENTSKQLKDQQIARIRSQLQARDQLVAECQKKISDASVEFANQKKKHQGQIAQLKVIYRREKQNLQHQWQSKLVEGMKQQQFQLKKKDEALNKRMESENKILELKEKVEAELFSFKEKQGKYSSIVKQNNQYKEQISKIKKQHQKQLLKQKAKIKSQLKLSFNQQLVHQQIKQQQTITTFKKGFESQLKKIKDYYDQSYKTLNVTRTKELETKQKTILKLQQDKKSLQSQIKRQSQDFELKESSFKGEKTKLEESIKRYVEQENTIKKRLIELYGPRSYIDTSTLSNNIINKLQQAREETTAIKQKYQKERKRVQQLAAYTEEIKKNIQDIIKFKNSISEANYCRAHDDPYHLGSRINELIRAFIAMIQQHKAEVLKKDNQNSQIRSQLIVVRDELSAQRTKNNRLLEQKERIEIQKLKQSYELAKLSQQFKNETQRLKQALQSQQSENEELRLSNQQLKEQNRQLDQQLIQALKQVQDLSSEVKKLEKLNRTLKSQLERCQAENLKLKKELQAKDSLTNGLSAQFSQKERILKDQFDRQVQDNLKKLNSTFEKVFGDQPSNPTFEAIKQYILTKTTSPSQSTTFTAFTVSEILERMPKQRQFLHSQCCEFLKCRDITSKLSFKYDENCKNFGYYVPTATRKFAFLVLFRAKKSQNVFGVVSSSIGRDSTSLAVNLTTMKTMNKAASSRAMPSSFENNVLKFGNEEISIKNGWGLDLNVNTGIIGERYFNFSREEFVGKGEVSPVALEAMEIHRIYTI